MGEDQLKVKLDHPTSLDLSLNFTLDLPPVLPHIATCWTSVIGPVH